MKEITIKTGIEDLNIFEKENDAWVTSRKIGEIFEKNHKDILEKINDILKSPDAFTERNFRLSSYKDKSGKKNKEYLLNRRSFVLIVMGFTGEKALKFKKAYIDSFERMFNLIQTRIISKEGYKIMTDAIKNYFINPQYYDYSNEADMINKIVLGMSAKQFRELNNTENIRDNIVQEKLNNLNKAQILNSQLIISGMGRQERKEIIEKNYYFTLI
jgi:Rha family phage regulatory protein